MKLTLENVNKTLRSINPSAYDAYMQAKVGLPYMIDRMFIEGFRKTLENDGDARFFLTSEQENLLLKVYTQLHETQGWITFEED